MDVPSEPIAGAKPTTYLELSDLDGANSSGDIGPTHCSRFEFKAMVNGGYLIRARLRDPNFNILRRLTVDQGYLKFARSRIYVVTFQIKWDRDAEPNVKATEKQRAYIISAHGLGDESDIGEIEFVAIDPSSWYLNAGDASGRAYRGRVSDVIRQVIDDYTNGNIRVSIGDTTDSRENRWWMMRLDPKTFIMSLLDWSAAVTSRQTNWLIAMDDDELVITEQAALASRHRALYKYYSGPGRDTISEWELLADNALSVASSKLVTHGISATSGRYFDRVTDRQERVVFVKDTTTPGKYKAKTTDRKAFTKAPDGQPPRTPVAGWSSIPAVPEIYSGGEIGRSYDQYIDGRARGLYLGLAGMPMRVRFRVIGHGIYDSGIGLGVDTITVQWLDANGEQFFLSGNWILYGFHHIMTMDKTWTTDLYCSRLDHDATAVPVP